MRIFFFQLDELFFHQYNYKEPELLLGDLSSSSFFLKAISVHEVKNGAVMYNLSYNDLSTRDAITKFKKPMIHMVSVEIYFTVLMLT